MQAPSQPSSLLTWWLARHGRTVERVSLETGSAGFSELTFRLSAESLVIYDRGLQAMSQEVEFLFAEYLARRPLCCGGMGIAAAMCVAGMCALRVGPPTGRAFWTERDAIWSGSIAWMCPEAGPLLKDAIEPQFHPAPQHDFRVLTPDPRKICRNFTHGK